MRLIESGFWIQGNPGSRLTCLMLLVIMSNVIRQGRIMKTVGCNYAVIVVAHYAFSHERIGLLLER